MINHIAIIYIKNCNKNNQLDFIFLKNLKKLYSRLIIVCDATLEYEERELLEEVTKDIIVEKFSTAKAAWKFCYREYLTEEERANCNELALIYMKFVGLIKNCEKVDSTIHQLDADIINICPCDALDDITSDFLIFKKRVLEDYSFDKFWKETKKDSLNLFENSGFRCLNYFGDEDLLIIRGPLSIGVNDYELKNNLRAIIDSTEVSGETKEMLIRNITRNSSSESIKNLFDLDFVLKNDCEAISTKGFTLCMFVETEEGLERVNNIIRNANTDWNIRVWLREEDFIDQITQERDSLLVDLYYRECMWEKIIDVIDKCQDYMIGFVFENGDILNWKNNYENMFNNVGMIAQLEESFTKNKYMAAILPYKYVGSDRFIRNELYRMQMQNSPEFSEFLWDIETPECAICCKTELIKECINNIESEAVTTCCEMEAVKIIPYLLQINGYMIGKAICDKNVWEYSKQLCEINEKQIRSSMKAGQIYTTDFSQYIEETDRLLKGYYTLYNRVKKLVQENRNLTEENKLLKKRKTNTQVKEVPVLVDIGVKQATKNWIKKHVGKE